MYMETVIENSAYALSQAAQRIVPYRKKRGIYRLWRNFAIELTQQEISAGSHDWEFQNLVYMARIIAVLRSHGPKSWASRQTAAKIWGLPTRPGFNQNIHLITKGNRAKSRHPLPPLPTDRGQITLQKSRAGTRQTPPVEIEGIRVLDHDETLIDCAQTHPLEIALPILDAGTRNRVGADRENPAETMQLCDRYIAKLQEKTVTELACVNLKRAQNRIRWAQPLAQSPAESTVRAHLISLGLTRFSLQHRWPNPRPHYGKQGSYYTDIYLPGLDNMIIEYDGETKLKIQQDLLAEKKREDDLREMCRAFIRLDADHLRNPGALKRKILTRLSLSTLNNLKPPQNI